MKHLSWVLCHQRGTLPVHNELFAKIENCFPTDFRSRLNTRHADLQQSVTRDVSLHPFLHFTLHQSGSCTRETTKLVMESQNKLPNHSFLRPTVNRRGSVNH